MNPYYIRGDFNGDGEMDVAFWVRNAETQQRGVAMVHSTLSYTFSGPAVLAQVRKQTPPTRSESMGGV